MWFCDINEVVCTNIIMYILLYLFIKCLAQLVYFCCYRKNEKKKKFCNSACIYVCTFLGVCIACKQVQVLINLLIITFEVIYLLHMWRIKLKIELHCFRF